MYQPKNQILKEYLDNNEAIEASVGHPVLISVEDVDIVIERILKEHIKIKTISKEKINHFAMASYGPIASTKDLESSLRDVSIFKHGAEFILNQK